MHTYLLCQNPSQNYIIQMNLYKFTEILIKKVIFTCVVSKWTLVLFGGFMYDTVSFQFVLSIKCSSTSFTLKWCVLSVVLHVKFQILLCFKSFFADVTNVLHYKIKLKLISVKPMLSKLTKVILFQLFKSLFSLHCQF